MKKKRMLALLSVYHKKGIVEFARRLLELGFDLLASGGTAKTLLEAGLPVRDVAELVGGEPILGHRVVTLSREIAAGLLAKNTPEDQAELERLGIPRIDLVCVDMYPLEQAIADPGATLTSVLEMTDIGGPNMLRAAAKGQRIVICDPEDRARVIEWLSKDKPDEDDFIHRLAAKAEAMVAQYVYQSARYQIGDSCTGIMGVKVRDLKYGENAQQKLASFYTTLTDNPLALPKFQQVSGVIPGFVNMCDIDRLLQTITHIAAVWDVNYDKVPCIAVAVKHGNPCGVGVSSDPLKALESMIEGDPLSIFGGFIMVNFAIGQEEAETLRNYLKGDVPRRILDGVLAPDIFDDAVSVLKRVKGACKMFVNGHLTELNKESLDRTMRYRPVTGGFLTQPNYTFVPNLGSGDIQKYGQASEQLEQDMLLAWAIGSTTNSNTITLVKDLRLIGNGNGQTARVQAAELAITKAMAQKHDIFGAAAYSDSFFPFKDGPETLIAAGISAIFTSSGSRRDQEVIDCCTEAETALYMVPDAIGRGFFGH